MSLAEVHLDLINISITQTLHVCHIRSANMAVPWSVWVQKSSENRMSLKLGPLSLHPQEKSSKTSAYDSRHWGAAPGAVEDAEHDANSLCSDAAVQGKGQHVVCVGGVMFGKQHGVSWVNT